MGSKSTHRRVRMMDHSNLRLYKVSVPVISSVTSAATVLITRFEMKGPLCFALFCFFFIGSQGFTIKPSPLLGGYSIVKPWMPHIQQAARYAVNAMGPWNRLIHVFHARQQVKKNLLGVNYN